MRLIHIDKFTAALLQTCGLICVTKIAMGASSSPWSNKAFSLAFSTNPAFKPNPNFKHHQLSAPTLASPASLFHIPTFSHRHNIPLKKNTATVLNLSKTANPPPPLPQNTEDPFLLLGIDPNNPSATDPKEIKRAYRKRAMQYHPDVVLNSDSSESEREKASRDFARINAAYEMLKGGDKRTGGGASSSNSSGSASSASGGSSYVPPHRRQGGYASTSSSAYGSKSTNNVRSTNWEDYMPNYDQEDAKYNADGDSFGAILSDLLSGAAGAAMGVASGYGGGSGSGGIFGDFVEFLERNVDGFQSGYDDDKSLSQLLTYGSFDEVANEMDETDVLVTSLDKKLSTVENERMQIEADLKLAQKYSEKLDLEERMEELKAREKVVKGYLKKGRSRLLRLRERYKELMVEGRGGRGYGSPTGASSVDSATSSGARTSSGSKSSTASSTATYSSPNPSSASTGSSRATASSSYDTASSSSSSASWRNEGFSGGYGRRSSSSRRSRRGNTGAGGDESSGPSANRSNNTSAAGSGAYRREQSTQIPKDNGRTGSTTEFSSASASGSIRRNTAASNEAWQPPHRRTQSSAESAAREKRRLRELKVDDEFERLKKEMGL